MEEEIITALEFLVKMFPQSKLIIAGHSAGGKLASHLLHKPKQVSDEIYNNVIGLILISGVYDLRPLVNSHINEPLKLTL